MQSSSHILTINKLTPNVWFYRPDALPVAQPTVSSTEWKYDIAHFHNTQSISTLLLLQLNGSILLNRSIF